MRILKTLTKWLVVIAMIMALVSASLFFTERGLQLLSKAVTLFVPGTLKIESLHGTLYSGISFEKFRYQDNHLILQVEKMKLKWEKLSPSMVSINSFKAHAIDIIRHEEAIDTKKKISLKDVYNNIKNSLNTVGGIFSHLTVKTLHINTIRYEQGSQHLNIANVSLENEKSAYEFKAYTLGGEISITQSLPDGTLTGVIQHLHPEYYYADWPGDLNFKFQIAEQTEEDQLDFRLDDIHGDLRHYSIGGRMHFVYGTKGITIDSAEVKSGTASISLHGSYYKTWDMHWQIRVPDLATILPDGQGEIISSGKLTGKIFEPNLDALVRITKLHWQGLQLATLKGELHSAPEQTYNFTGEINNLNYEDYKLPVLTLIANGQIQKNDLLTNFKAAFNKHDSLDGKIQFPGLFKDQNTAQSIAGDLSLHVGSIKDKITLPYVKEMDGKLSAAIHLDGQLKDPNVSGNLNLTNAHVSIPTYGLNIHSINLHALHKKDKIFNVNGEVISGRGKAKIDGNVDVANIEGFITISGNNLTFINTIQYRVIVDPMLKLGLRNKVISIDGNIFIPEANISVNENNNVMQLPEEVVFVDKTQSNEKQPSHNLKMNVDIKLGDKVKVAYENLKTKLTGALRIIEEPQGLPLATGELRTVNGRYRAYNNLLNITAGRLIYTGSSLTNPGLAIVAEKKVRKVGLQTSGSQYETKDLGSVYTGTETLTVGIKISGTLNKPYLSLFSSPETLDRNDILSYLVFGYPRSSIENASKLQLLSQIASHIDTGKSTPGIFSVTDKIKKKLGLSELEVGTTEYLDTGTGNLSNATTVNIGKKFGKRLSVHYSVGIFDSLSILNLKYQLNKRLAVQTETSSMGNGADLVYEFERD